MKTNLLFFILVCAIAKPGCCQDSLRKVTRIDSVLAKNQLNVSSIYQKTEPSIIELMHRSNPEQITEIYRFSATKMLLSFTNISCSVDDTDLIVNLYFDSNKLVKAKTSYFDRDKKQWEFFYYYDKDGLINKADELNGIHSGSFYLMMAAKIRRSLKKRPIHFP